MFFLKAGCFLISKNLRGYVDDHRCYIKHVKRLLYTVQTHSSVDYGNSKAHLYIESSCSNNKFIKKSCLNVQSRARILKLTIDGCRFCTIVLPKDPDTFGDVAGQQYESVPMDEAEKKEEEFAEFVRVPSRQKFSEKDYIMLIKKHLEKSNLEMALSVLHFMISKGTKPTIFIYRLLISAYAKQGDVKQCFKLFKEMLNRGIPSHPAVISSLINACAETDDTNIALKHLSYLREFCHTRHIVLNQKHYLTFIKAYGRHRQYLLAFELADTTRDKHINSTEVVCALFHSVIANRNNGLKLAVILWHKMKITRIKPDLRHYNLLLRAIRDTYLGDLDINDNLIPGARDTQIQVTISSKSDLLESPPVISDMITSVAQSPNLLISDSNDSKQSEIIQSQSPLVFPKLNSILKINRLVLFGGINGLLERMEQDNVTPNAVTITLLLELLPQTIDPENHLLRYIEQNHIDVDITFFNTLIRRRCFRKQYEDAKNVMYYIQKHRLLPDAYTFSALAIGCKTYTTARELLQQMDNMGYAPNIPILQILMLNAYMKGHVKYMLRLMKCMLDNKLNPSPSIMDILRKFDALGLKICENKVVHDHKEVDQIKMYYNEFKIEYERLKMKMQKNVGKKTKPDRDDKVFAKIQVEMENVSKIHRRQAAALNKKKESWSHRR